MSSSTYTINKFIQNTASFLSGNAVSNNIVSTSITGSLTGSVSGSLYGTASWAQSSSYAITASYALNGGTGTGGTIYNNNYNNNYNGSVPIGTIISSIQSGSVPTGYLLCDGRYILKSSYPSLATVIYQPVGNLSASFGKRYNLNGTVFTLNEDGVYFKLPDLRGVFLRGFNDGLKNSNNLTSSYDSGSNLIRKGARKFGSLQEDAIEKHNHIFLGNSDQAYAPWGRTTDYTHKGMSGEDSGNDYFYTGDGTQGQGGNDPGVIDNETRPTNVSVNYFIKATDDDFITVTNVTTASYATNAKNAVTSSVSDFAYDNPFPRIVAAISFVGNYNTKDDNAQQYISSAYNIKSVTRVGSNKGIYTINFDTPVSLPYYVVGTTGGPSGAHTSLCVSTKTTSAITTYIESGLGTDSKDVEIVDIMVFQNRLYSDIYKNSVVNTGVETIAVNSLPDNSGVIVTTPLNISVPISTTSPNVTIPNNTSTSYTWKNILEYKQYEYYNVDPVTKVSTSFKYNPTAILNKDVIDQIHSSNLYEDGGQDLEEILTYILTDHNMISLFSCGPAQGNSYNPPTNIADSVVDYTGTKSGKKYKLYIYPVYSLRWNPSDNRNLTEAEQRKIWTDSCGRVGRAFWYADDYVIQHNNIVIAKGHLEGDTTSNPDPSNNLRTLRLSCQISLFQ